MQILDQYKIQFSGLTSGHYHYDCEIMDSFFELTAFPDVEHGKLSVGIDLNKQENMMIFQFHLEGAVELMCDRCLENFSYPLTINEQLIVKQVVEIQESEDDSLIYLDIKEHTIDLTHILYEYISVSIPFRHVHPENEQGVSGCDPEMIEKIENYSKRQFISPWDALKDLSSENNN